MSLTIDSTIYDVPIISIDRKLDKLYKYAQRTQSGNIKKELIGVYYNCPNITMGMSANNVVDYNALLSVLADTEEFHDITLPDIDGSGNVTFSVYFDNISDNVVKWTINGVHYFRGLTFSVVAEEPFRIP
jgi:hypothetical protein